MLSRSSFLQALVFLLSLSLIAPLSAHEVRPAIVDINLDGKGHYKMSIKTNLEALISQVEQNVDNTDDSENADVYFALREMPAQALAGEFLHFEDNLLTNIHLKLNGKDLKIEVSSIDIPDVGDLDLARDSVLYFEGDLPANPMNLSWQWDAKFGNAALRVSTDKNPELFSEYLKEGKVSKLVSLNTAKPDSNAKKNDCNDENLQKVGGCTQTTLTTASQTNGWDTFVNYISVGFTHIVPLGIDHILFVIGLFLLSAQLRPLLIQVTTFTIAHTVTLALGMFGILNVSSAIVEPLIAASIIYVAIENIFFDKLTRWRPIIVFLFGLLHGLGFASVLKEFGLVESNYISGLIGFNVGVELGQLTVITICFLAVGFWFRNKPWYRQRITIPASILIAVVAAYWFIERIDWV